MLLYLTYHLMLFLQSQFKLDMTCPSFSQLQLEIQSADEKRLSLAMCMAFYTQSVLYEEDMEFGSKLTQAQRECMTTRFRFKPGNFILFEEIFIVLVM